MCFVATPLKIRGKVCLEDVLLNFNLKKFEIIILDESEKTFLNVGSRAFVERLSQPRAYNA